MAFGIYEQGNHGRLVEVVMDDGGRTVRADAVDGSEIIPPCHNPVAVWHKGTAAELAEREDLGAIEAKHMQPAVSVREPDALGVNHRVPAASVIPVAFLA